MSKKNKVVKKELAEEELESTATIVVDEKPNKDAKSAGKDKKTNKKKKEKGPNKIVKKTKETFSELKKVTWPKPKEVAKKTGVVLAVVVIFALVLFGIDYLLSLLFGLFTGAIK